MTTDSSEVLAAIEDGTPEADNSTPRDVHAGTRARLADTLSDSKAAATVQETVATAWWDARSSWVWRTPGPTLTDLWAHRKPDRDKVPGHNRALYVAWVTYNHLVLIAAVLLAALFVVLEHPARFLLAAPIVAALIIIWAS